MAYAVNLTGTDLANHLAVELTDLEFELLVRERIKIMLANTRKSHPNLAESHDSVDFRFSVTDKSMWDVSLGETYSKYASTKGEVLSSTMHDVLEIIDARDRNKLSLLLAGPAPKVMMMSANGSGAQPEVADSQF